MSWCTTHSRQCGGAAHALAVRLLLFASRRVPRGCALFQTLPAPTRAAEWMCTARPATPPFCLATSRARTGGPPQHMMLPLPPLERGKQQNTRRLPGYAPALFATAHRQQNPSTPLLGHACAAILLSSPAKRMHAQDTLLCQ